jgi:hypothetical protein
MSTIMDDQAPDVFCAELTRIDRLGCNRRLIFTIPSTEGGQYKTVQVKLIVAADYLPTMAVLIASDGGWGAVGAIDTKGAVLAAFAATGEAN